MPAGLLQKKDIKYSKKKSFSDLKQALFPVAVQIGFNEKNYRITVIFLQYYRLIKELMDLILIVGFYSD
jgi:hypothetical protein